MRDNPNLDPIAFLGVADPVSALLHLGGALVFAVLGVGLLIRARGNLLRVAAIAIYLVGVLFTLTVSGLFHLSTRGTELRDLLLVVDHAGIFFLIAASYGPIHIIQFSGFMRWGVLALVWGAALGGIVLKSFWFDIIPEWISLTLYLALGWAGLITAVALYRMVGFTPLWPLIGGALAYTLGAVFEFARVPTLIAGVVGPHEIFHILVLVGIALHWEYIRRIAVHTPTTDRYRSSLPPITMNS